MWGTKVALNVFCSGHWCPCSSLPTVNASSGNCCGHSWVCCLGHKSQAGTEVLAGQCHTGHSTAQLICFYGQGRWTQTLNCQEPLRMQNATLKKGKGKAIQGEEKDGNIYHSTTLTKNKPWQQAPMHCLVYANAGCSSCWDQKHNKLSVSLNPEGSDSYWPCWQSLLPVFEWERWIGETATLEHGQDCFYKSKTVFTSSSF